MEMRSDRIKPDKWILMLFIGIVATLSLMVYFFSPLLDGILMGVAFSYVAKPIKKKLDTKMNKNVSSLIATLIILVPVSILLFYGIFQGIMQAANIITHQKEFQDQIIDILKDSGLSEYYIKQIESFIPNILSFISKNILQMSAIDLTFKIISFVMNFFISMVVCFYALADGDTFIKKSLRIIPDEYRTKFGNFIEEVDNVFLGLWFGNFAVAVLIGIASIPFFLAFNIPYTALLSGLIFLAALIPVFAEWMVLIPVTIYIALQSVHAAIWFIVLGAIFLYILPELILRPYLLSYTSRIHPLIILLSFIGGGMVAGVTGFFLAPMIAGLVTAIYNIYTR